MENGAVDNQKPKRSVQITVPEQLKATSDDVWHDLETFLYTGFLTSSTSINNCTFVFKTLNQHEMCLMSYMRPLSSDFEVQSVFRSQFIAHSIFMIDGRNILHRRPDNINRIIKVVSKLSTHLQNKIVENLSLLNEKGSRLFPLVEVYAYENRSRFKWMHIKTSQIHSPLNTGIPGTEELGMNGCQQTWVALNHIMDIRENMDREWANAKFIGSCLAGKGVKSIDERDKARSERERNERNELKMKVLYKYINKLDMNDESSGSTVTLPDGRTAIVVRKFKTEKAEDLAEELSAALSGEKDHHDMVIEAKQKELQTYAATIEEHKARMFAAPNTTGSGLGSRIIGGKAEAEEYAKRMKDGVINRMESMRRNLNPGDDPFDNE